MGCFAVCWDVCVCVLLWSVFVLVCVFVGCVGCGCLFVSVLCCVFWFVCDSVVRVGLFVGGGVLVGCVVCMYVVLLWWCGGVG